MGTLTATFKVPSGATGTKTITIPDPVDPQVPPSPGGRRIGIYLSGNNTGLDNFTTTWAKKPNITSFYVPWGSGVPALAKTHAGQGRWLQMELATKYGSTSYKTWANIAAGAEDAAIATFVKACEALNTKVLLSLDNEPELKWANADSTHEVASGQTAEQYVAAANRFADVLHANSPSGRVESSVWFASGSASQTGSFFPAKAKLDNIGWDPYKTGTHAASETATQLFGTFVKNLLVPKGYDQIPRHINETGIKVDPFTSGGSFDVPTQKAFYNSIPAAMDALNIESVVWFRANSGAHDYIPTDPTVDQTFRDMLASALP